MPERIIGQTLDGNVPKSRQDGPGQHRTTTTERGSFISAQCSCGWRGPARRSRDKARGDAETHTRDTGP